MAYLHASSMYDGNEDEERVDEDDRNDEEENGVSLIANDPERDEQESNESNQECNDSHHHQTHTQNVKVVKVVPLPHARSEVWSYFGFIADDEGEIQDKKKAICKICASTLSYSGNTTNLFTHLKAFHPEAQFNKLQPTNRTPRLGKKLKRKLNIMESPAGQLIFRAITYSNQQSHDQHTTNENELFDDESSFTTQTQQSPEQTSISHSPSKALVVHQNKSIVNQLAITSTNSIVATSDVTDGIVNWLVKDCRPICVAEGKGFQEFVKLLAPGYMIPEPKRLRQLVKRKYDEHRRDLILKAMQDE